MKRRRHARQVFSGTEQTEQIRERIDRVLADGERLVQELRDLRAAITGERAGELTEAEERELRELAERRAARMRQARGGRP